MKKTLSLLLAAALCISCAACGKNAPAEETTAAEGSAAPGTEETTQTVEEIKYRVPVKEITDGEYVWRDADELESYSELRDPFLKPDGSRVRTPEEFYANTAYLREAMQHYVYGHMPPRPEKIETLEQTSEEILGGKAVMEYRTLSFDGLSMKIRIAYPKGAKGLPVIMKLDYLCEKEFAPAIEDEMLLAGKYVFVTISRKDLCEDEPKDRSAMPYREYGLGAVGIWAFGAIVCLDYIQDMEILDSSRVALTGHSRDGKAAICAAAMDERFAAVIPNGSGCGGAGSFTVQSSGCEGLGTILSNLGTWFTSELSEFKYYRKARQVPVDMIFALALIAPRPVLCTEAKNDTWANPLGTYTNITALNRICDFLGYPEDTCGMIIRPGDHNQTKEDWLALVEFTDRVFYGVTPDMDFNQQYYELTDEIPWVTP